MRPLIGRIVIYPALLAAAWVLSWYIEPLPPVTVLLRPVLVAIAVTVLMQAAFTLVAREPHRGAFLAAFSILLLVQWQLALVMLLAVLVPLLVNSVRRRKLATLDWPRFTRFLTLGVATVLIGTIALGATRGVVPTGPETPLGDPNAGAGHPDIYLIMLDGYPRADTLARDFAFDNEPFLMAMESEGFQVARNAHSNYNITWLTLASMFNVEHITKLVGDRPPRFGDELGVLSRLINGGTALETARRSGYELIGISSGFVSASLTSADRYIDTGQVNSFEAPLLRTGFLVHVLPEPQADVMHGQLRDRFNASIDTARGMADEVAIRPRLIFTHLFAPHPPIVFDEKGGPTGDDGCYPTDCGLWDQVYDINEPEYLREELEYVNGRLLETIRHILSTNARPAVVVVFSDHGFRHDFDDVDEMVHSLFLSYTPDRAELFADDASPINVLPTLLNAYAGTEIPLAADLSFIADFRKFSTQQSYFPLIPIEP